MIETKDYMIRKIYPSAKEDNIDSEEKAVTFLPKPTIVVICPFNEYTKVAFDHQREQAKMFKLLMVLMPSMAQKSYNKRL